MMLKTSSRKINPFLGMIKSTYRKNFGIIIVLCIMALLLCPGSYFVNFAYYYKIRLSAINPNGTTPSEFTETFGTIVAGFTPIFVMLFNFVNFTYLYKKNSSDVFHSFPLTRAELLLSRMIGGILSALTPVALCTGCYIITILLHPWLGSFGILLYYLALTLVLTLLWSAFSLIFVVCAGSGLDLSLSFFGVNIAIILVSIIANSIFSSSLLGYNNNTTQILINVSLPFFCATHATVGFWIKSIIFIAAFTTIAVLLYNRRKAEKGGTAYAYKFMYYICSVLASICGGWLIGVLFDGSTTAYSGVFWFFSLVGAMLFALIFGLITNRGFKGASRSLISGGVALGLIIVIFISSLLGGFGFTKRVPNNRRIKEVAVFTSADYIIFTDPDIVIALHEKAIKGAKQYKKDPYFYDYDNKGTYGITFDYTLKSGAKISRNFQVPLSTVENELLTVLKSKERYEVILENSHANDTKIDHITLKTYRYGYAQEYTITQDQYKHLIETYWQDIQYIDNIADMTDKSENISFTIYYQTEDSTYSTYHFQIRCNQKFYETLNLLNDFDSIN